MNPTSKTVTITLGGSKRSLYFDLNTFAAFEESTGRFFLDFLASLQTATQDAQVNKDPMRFLGKLGLKDIRALAWAAMHEYDAHDNPVWPLTLQQVGRLINIDNIKTVIPALMQGAITNAPDEDDLGPAPSRPPEPGGVGSPPGDGGDKFGPTDDEVLGSLTKN